MLEESDEEESDEEESDEEESDEEEPYTRKKFMKWLYKEHESYQRKYLDQLYATDEVLEEDKVNPPDHRQLPPRKSRSSYDSDS